MCPSTKEMFPSWAPAGTELSAATPIPQLFLDRAARSADRVSSNSKIDGRWQSRNWRAARQAVLEVALGLLDLGVRPGDRVAILSQTRREWQEADLANLSIGAITVGIYPSLTGAQATELLVLSGARVVFAENVTQMAAVQAHCAHLQPRVQFILFDDPGAQPEAVSMGSLKSDGARRHQLQPEEFERRVQEVRADDVASYIYTSGTTGAPKGAVLTHANFHYVMQATSSVIDYTGQRVLVFLPLAHALQRYTNYLGLIRDVEGYFAESLDKVQENMQEVQPTLFALVPRVLEKIHARAVAVAQSKSAVQTRIFEWCMQTLSEAGRARRAHPEADLGSGLSQRLADRLVGKKVRARLGGRVQYIGSGGAALARPTHEFFEDLGIPILEGYGLTETSAPVTLNTLSHRRIGTVGRALPGTEVKIGGQGEILVRGPGVFAEYFENREATQAAFDAEGWFKTGDIGELSVDGYLKVTDRIKDIIVTSSGKNIAPQPIENELQGHGMVGQAIVVGDRRPYLTALIALDPEAMADGAHGLGNDPDPQAVAELPEIKAELDLHLQAVNATRPRHEQIKKILVLPETLSIDNGVLTPTLKVKRRCIMERYPDEVRRLYDE